MICSSGNHSKDQVLQEKHFNFNLSYKMEIYTKFYQKVEINLINGGKIYKGNRTVLKNCYLIGEKISFIWGRFRQFWKYYRIYTE